MLIALAVCKNRVGRHEIRPKT